MNRQDAIELIIRMRRQRNICRKNGDSDMFARGMAVGYELSSRMIWGNLQLDKKEARRQDVHRREIQQRNRSIA
jgi:hypothetical protein